MFEIFIKKILLLGIEVRCLSNVCIVIGVNLCLEVGLKL